MNNILIDRALRKCHEAGISQRRQFWGKITRFHHDDFVRGWLQAEPREVDKIVVWSPLRGENKRDSFDLHHSLTQARCLRRQQKNYLARRFDWLTTKRIERCAYGEWDGGADASLVAGVRSRSVGDSGEDNIFRFEVKQPFQHFSAIAGAAQR